MENLTLIHNLHLVAALLLIVIVCVRAYTLFVGTEGNLPNPVARRIFVAIQHSALTLIVITGAGLLMMRQHELQLWFYAKIILFCVLLSSLIKAYKKTDTVLLIQRKAGWILALVAYIAVYVLTVVQPSFS